MAQHVSTQFTNKIRNPSFNVIGASRFIYKRSRETKRNNFTMSEKNLAPVSSAVSTDTDVTSLDMQGLDAGDAALHQKIKLINDAIDEIGFTPYHFKLFCLSGMGYATDSQLTFIESSVRTFVNYQFGYTYPVSSQCLYFGMLLGTLFWGFGADLIGRKLAFNLSLLLSAVLTILTGAMGTFTTYCLFIILSCFAAGGNLVLDTCVFLEYLPHKNQWLLTFFAFFWGIGQTLAVLFAWAFLPKYSCASEDYCPSHIIYGLRYTFYVNGAFVLVIALLRIFVVRLKETPKFLVSNNRDAEAVETLQNLAAKYNRPCSLTLEALEDCGEITANDDFRVKASLMNTFRLSAKHIKILFSNRKTARSTSLLITSWLLLGIAYPLYSAFLPQYLASRGVNVSADSTYGVYRDNVISNLCSCFGPMIAGLLLYFVPWLGRRGVMVIGALSTMALLFGYTQVKNRAGNVGLSSAVYIAIYVYYGCLYAYTPEVMPSAARATGNALCIAATRVTGVIVPVIAYFAGITTSAPIWICGAFVGVIGCIALLFPYEPSKMRVV